MHNPHVSNVTVSNVTNTTVSSDCVLYRRQGAVRFLKASEDDAQQENAKDANQDHATHCAHCSLCRSPSTSQWESEQCTLVSTEQSLFTVHCTVVPS